MRSSGRGPQGLGRIEITDRVHGDLARAKIEMPLYPDQKGRTYKKGATVPDALLVEDRTASTGRVHLIYQPIITFPSYRHISVAAWQRGSGHARRHQLRRRRGRARARVCVHVLACLDIDSSAWVGGQGQCQSHVVAQSAHGFGDVSRRMDQCLFHVVLQSQSAVSRQPPRLVGYLPRAVQ